MQNRKMFFAIIIAVAVVAAAGAWFYLSKNQVKAYEFVGSIKSFADNSVVLEGLFVIADRPDLKIDKTEATVIFEPSTRFIKESIKLPKPGEVGLDGTFKVDDLEKDSKAVLLEELKTDYQKENFSLNVKSSKNIYGSKRFTASEVFYRVPILPLDQ